MSFAAVHSVRENRQIATPIIARPSNEDREQLAARLRVAADRAYDQLAGGLGEYGKG